MSIGKELAKAAKEKGICKDWFVELKNETDTDKMLDMYIRGIDFCLSNDFPSNEYIRKNFVGKMEKHGIHIDEKLIIENESKVVALGKCTGTIKVTDYLVGEIYIKHNSNLTIIACDNTFLMVDLFDNSRLTVIASGSAKVCVNKYLGSNELEYHSNDSSVIRVYNKNKKSYKHE